MSTIQNQNYVVTNISIDLVNNIGYVDVAFFDADDGNPSGMNRYTLPATGPILDLRGRTVAASVPANVITDYASLKTHVLAAIATGSAAGKVKP